MSLSTMFAWTMVILGGGAQQVPNFLGNPQRTDTVRSFSHIRSDDGGMPAQRMLIACQCTRGAHHTQNACFQSKLRPVRSSVSAASVVCRPLPAKRLPESGPTHAAVVRRVMHQLGKQTRKTSPDPARLMR